MLRVQTEGVASVSTNNEHLRNMMNHLSSPDFLPLFGFQLCQHTVAQNNSGSFSLLFSFNGLVWGLGDIYSDNPLSDFSLAICSESHFKTQAQVDPLTYIRAFREWKGTQPLCKEQRENKWDYIREESKTSI